MLAYPKQLNFVESVQNNKMVKLNNLKQAYVDLRLNKQLDEHDKFKARIEDTWVKIVQTTKILDVAEFEVD